MESQHLRMDRIFTRFFTYCSNTELGKTLSVSDYLRIISFSTVNARCSFEHCDIMINKSVQLIIPIHRFFLYATNVLPPVSLPTLAIILFSLFELKKKLLKQLFVKENLKTQLAIITTSECVHEWFIFVRLENKHI